MDLFHSKNNVTLSVFNTINRPWTLSYTLVNSKVSFKILDSLYPAQRNSFVKVILNVPGFIYSPIREYYVDYMLKGYFIYKLSRTFSLA